jgi:ArsR family transcriptional regulator, arsenate/arsenite/antimonite-responsive transcriptional repressor
MKLDDAITRLSALAQDTRATIYRLLVKRGPEGDTPGELVTKTEIPAPTLSFHSKELQRADLLGVRSNGRSLYYGANFPQMQQLVVFAVWSTRILMPPANQSQPNPTQSRPKTKRA